MGECFCRIEKLKSIGTMKSRWNHDVSSKRIELVSGFNADPLKYYENEDLTPMLMGRKAVKFKDKDMDTQDDYGDRFKKRLASIDRYKEKLNRNGLPDNLRKNAVHAFDVVMSFSLKEEEKDKFNLEKWKEANIAWLNKTFNKAGDGQNNVVSVVMHTDEKNIHLHAIVVPIDENNKLNASRWTNGYVKMQQLQASYTESMNEVGLSHLHTNSYNKHSHMRDMYKKLKQSISLPEPLPNELAIDYIARNGQMLEAERAQHRIQLEQAKYDHTKMLAQQEEAMKQAIKDEYDEMIMSVPKDVKKFKNKRDSLEKEVRLTTQTLINLQQSLKQYENIEYLLEQGKLMKKYKEVLAEYTLTNPELADDLKNALDIVESYDYHRSNEFTLT